MSKNYLIDEIFEPEIYINEIEHQLMIIQTFLDKLQIKNKSIKITSMEKIFK